MSQHILPVAILCQAEFTWYALPSSPRPQLPAGDTIKTLPRNVTLEYLPCMHFHARLLSNLEVTDLLPHACNHRSEHFFVPRMKGVLHDGLAPSVLCFEQIMDLGFG